MTPARCRAGEAHPRTGVLAGDPRGLLVLLDRQSDRFLTLDNLLNQGRLMTEVGLSRCR